MRRVAILLALLLVVSRVHAETRPASTNYVIPTEVQAVGGGEAAQSTNYRLDDTIGEANIGQSRTANYTLDAGYRQTSETTLSMTCSSPTNLGSITRTGDTSVNTCGTAGYCSTNKTTCTVITDNATGYTLAWVIATGTGAMGARTGTGYLNGSVLANRIAPLGTGSTVASAQPIAMVAGAGTVNNDARWAGRLSSTSTTTGGAGKAWGADGTGDTWLRVSTGSSVNIASRTVFTDGDTENIGFRAIIHGTAIVPNDTYKATITFTATAN